MSNNASRFDVFENTEKKNTYTQKGDFQGQKMTN
jgi:hypothetical protein